jgi:hypothetical protein
MNRSKETLNYHICGEGVKIENHNNIFGGLPKN